MCDRNCIGSVLEEAMSCFSEMQRQTEEKFRVWMEKLIHLDSGEEHKHLLEPRGSKMQLGQRISPDTQSGAYMQIPDSQVLPQQPFGSYETCQNVDSTLEFPKTFNSTFPNNVTENGNITEQPLNLSQN